MFTAFSSGLNFSFQVERSVSDVSFTHATSTHGSVSLDGRVVIRLSISGPRRSGNVETTSSGEILTATVS